MESRPCQRGNSRYVVPLGCLAISLLKQVHLAGSRVVTQETDAENYQMLAVQTMFTATKYCPGVEDKGQVHPVPALTAHSPSKSLVRLLMALNLHYFGSEIIPPENITLSNVLFRLLLVKLSIFAPGFSVSCCPTLTGVAGIAAQTFLPSFSRFT